MPGVRKELLPIHGSNCGFDIEPRVSNASGFFIISRGYLEPEAAIASHMGVRAMTARIREFLRTRREDGPCVVVDLDVVRDNYDADVVYGRYWRPILDGFGA